MSKNLQHFVNNFVLGMQLGDRMQDRRDTAAYRRAALEASKAKTEQAGRQFDRRMANDDLRTQGYLSDIERKRQADLAKAARGAGGGKAAKGPMDPRAVQWAADNGVTGVDDPTTQAAPSQTINNYNEAPDTGTPMPAATDFGGGGGNDDVVEGAARGGRMGQAINTGMRIGQSSARFAQRQNGGTMGTTGPGSGFGAVAAPPAGAIDLSGTGEVYRRGGAVRRYAEGGPVLPEYERPYYSRDAYPWQGPDPATGRPPDEYLPDRRYPSTPPMNRDQSPDRYYAEDPGYGGREANREVDRRMPPEGSPPLTGREFPFAYPRNTYAGPMSPQGGQAYPARPIAPERGRLGGNTSGRAQPRRAADGSAIETGSGFMDVRTQPGTRPDVGLAEEPGAPPTSDDFRARPAETIKRATPNLPVTGGGVARLAGGVLEQTLSDDRRANRTGFVGEEDRANEDPENRGLAVPPAVRDPGETGGPATGGGDPVVRGELPASGAAPPARGAPPPARGAPPAGGGGGGGRGAINTSGGPWKRLRDQSRAEAYDPQKDLYDPDNVHATAAPLAGATAYADRVFHQGNTPGQVQGQGGGMGEAPNGLKQRGQVALYSGHGAADPKLMEQIFQKVDPKGTMSMEDRMAASVKAPYDFYMANGDTENANKSVFEVAQFANKVASEHGKEALKLIQSGNMQGATDMLVKGYNFLPDGHTASIQNGQITITDKAGNVAAQYPVDQRSMMNIAMGMASGQLNWDVMRHGGMMSGGGGAPAAPPGAAPAQQAAAQPAAAPAGPSQTPAAPATVTPPLRAPATPAQQLPASPSAPAAAPASGPRTHDGLPARQNPDGSISTELSITVTDPRLNGGRPTNIPSLWGGREVPQDQAVTNALQSGKPYQSFNSIPEAVKAAEARSAAGGANAPASPPAAPGLAPVPSTPARTPAAPATGGAPAVQPAGETRQGVTPGVPSQGDAVPTKPAIDTTKTPVTRAKPKSPEEIEQEHFNAHPYDPPEGVTRLSTTGRNMVLNESDAHRVIEETRTRVEQAIAAESKRGRGTPGVTEKMIAAAERNKRKTFDEWRKETLARVKHDQTQQDAVDRDERNIKLRVRDVPEGGQANFDATISKRVATLKAEAQQPFRSGGDEKAEADQRKRDYAASPLSWMTDPKDGEVFKRIVTGIWRHNKHNNTSVTEAVDAANLLTSIVLNRPDGSPGVGGNRQKSGPNATTYTPQKVDLNGNYILKLGDKSYHLDPDTYRDVVRLQQNNWKQYEKGQAAVKKSGDSDAAAMQAIKTLMPNLGSFKPKLFMPGLPAAERASGN